MRDRVVNDLTIGATQEVVLLLLPLVWPAPFGFPATWVADLPVVASKANFKHALS